MKALDPTVTQKTSQIISRQVKHMTGLVDDLLDLSRVTRGLVTLSTSPIDLKSVVYHAVEQVRPFVEAQRHQLLFDLAADTAHVMGDQKRLVQIVTNLLNNAAKYTPRGGVIRIRLAVDAGMLTLSVEDNGIGIPADLQPHVFDLFTQADRASDRAQGGLGIGLALVKNLTELHGGTVSCVSAGKDRGSTFTVVLPRHRVMADPAPNMHGQASALGRSQLPLRILVVDDNADAAQMLAMFLETLGHHVFVEHSPLDALACARRERPDVCILDIGLPDMDGKELARQLRAGPDTGGAFLIALTGYGQAQDRIETNAAGFDRHLVKPVDAASLADLLGTVSASGRALPIPGASA
jgi:CheY-like chemotaxis protein/two-component sensor histidine kinase